MARCGGNSDVPGKPLAMRQAQADARRKDPEGARGIQQPARRTSGVILQRGHAAGAAVCDANHVIAEFDDDIPAHSGDRAPDSNWYKIADFADPPPPCIAAGIAEEQDGAHGQPAIFGR
jgi:hypothetical protein